MNLKCLKKSFHLSHATAAKAISFGVRGVALAFLLLGLLCPCSDVSSSEVSPKPTPKPKPLPIPTDVDENAARDAKKKEADLPPGFDWDAQRVSFDEKNNAYILSGNAFIRAPGPAQMENNSIKLEADNIIYYRATKEIYSEGNVRLRLGESEMAAQIVYLHLIKKDNIDDVVGYLVEANVRVSAPPDALTGLVQKTPQEKQQEEREEVRQLSPDKLGVPDTREKDLYGIYIDPRNDPQARTNLMFRASRVVIHNRKSISAEDAFIATDDMVHPMYGVSAGKIEFHILEIPDPKHPGKTILKPHKIVARRGRINIMGVKTFPFPTITYDLVKKNAFFSQSYGNTKRWGPFSLTRVGYGLGGGENKLFDPTRIYIDLEERYKRGAGGGGEFEWQTGYRPPESLHGDAKGGFERGVGHARVWAIDEFQTPRAADILRARRDLERRVQPKIDGFPRREFDANLLFLNRRRLEDAGPPSFNIDTHRDEWRGFVDFAHHQPLKRFSGIDNLQLDMKYQKQTDRDAKLEYFQNNYMTNNQSEALVALRKPGDNYSVELLYRGNPQDFDSAPPRSPFDYGTFTNYEPALTYSLVPTPLYHGFVLTGEAQAARLRRDFERSIYDQSGFEVDRLYTKFDVARPYKLGALNIVPHVGTQQQVYDNSRTGDSVHQGALTYGLDTDMRFYGTFLNFENDALGLKGLRHIIEPRISYNAIGDTSSKAENLLDFDAVDDLTPVDKVTFAFDQTFQTRRQSRDGSESHASNFAGFDMAVDLYPRLRDQKRLLDGDHLDLFRMDGFLRVLDIVRFDAGVGFSLEDGQLEKAVYGIEIDPQTRWKLKFEERFNFEDRNSSKRILGSDQFRVKFEYQLSERWGIAVEQIQERRNSVLSRKGRQTQHISLTRHYGALDATFNYSIDPTTGGKTYYATVRPALVYRNIVVPTQDLLVDSAEVSGDSEIAEENNYNPFSLLKNKQKNATPKKPKNKKDTTPSSAPKDDSVPTPPPPTSDPKTSMNHDDFDDSELGSFEAPNTPEPKAASKNNTQTTKPDDDEWTAPAPAPTPVPASTR